MKSRLYDCSILHVREIPKPHRFQYSYSYFCLDLDEVNELSKTCFLIGTSFWNYFRFCPSDYIFGAEAHDAKEMKSKIISYAERKGVQSQIKRVEVVSNLRSWGYSYNPAAFYFCYGSEDQPLCAMVEVTNTFGERKVYFVGQTAESLQSVQKKSFYVSPFIDLNSEFEFHLQISAERLALRIDSRLNEEVILRAIMWGQAVDLGQFPLWRRLLRQPWASASVMLRIHWQAFRLFIKNIPYSKKSENPDLQKGGLS